MIKNFFHILKSSKGFSLVEVVLFIVISAILLGVTTDIMVGQVEAYSYLTNRQNTLEDSQFALTRISNDLLRIPTGGLLAVDDDSVNFIDSEGNATSFNVSNGDLNRGNETLLESVQSFQVAGLDSNGNETETLSDIKKLQVTVVTQPLDTEGSMTLTTTITPRVFVYQNYQ